MSTPKVNLALREGETFRQRLRWLDSKSKPINLTGATVEIQFRDKADASTVLMDLTVANGRITVTPTLGIIDLYLSPTDTLVPFARAAWDCRVTLSNGDVRYLAEGNVIVARSVTL